MRFVWASSLLFSSLLPSSLFFSFLRISFILISSHLISSCLSSYLFSLPLVTGGQKHNNCSLEFWIFPACKVYKVAQAANAQSHNSFTSSKTSKKHIVDCFHRTIERHHYMKGKLPMVFSGIIVRKDDMNALIAFHAIMIQFKEEVGWTELFVQAAGACHWQGQETHSSKWNKTFPLGDPLS